MCNICLELDFQGYFYSLWFTTSILWVIVEETDAGNLSLLSSWEENSDSQPCQLLALYSHAQGGGEKRKWLPDFQSPIASFLKVSTYAFDSLTNFVWSSHSKILNGMFPGYI